MITRVFKKSNKKAFDLKFFVHIPKTAGTSFRNGIENQSTVICDYEQRSPSTSKIVQESIYKEQDFFKLYKKLEKENVDWLSGHVSVTKYSNFVDPRNIVVFFRDPLEQTFSHYKHQVKHMNYKGDIEKFIEEKRFVNFQHKWIAGFPIELIGVIGITELYNDSITIVNKQLGLNVPSLSSNVNADKGDKAEILTKKLAHRLRAISPNDFFIYNKAKWLLNNRKELHEKNLTWVHGIAHINAKNEIVGVAWNESNDELVTLCIIADDKEIATVNASLLYQGHIKAKLPRGSYISYKYCIPDELKNSDHFDVVVKQTRQKLNYGPLKIKV